MNLKLTHVIQTHVINDLMKILTWTEQPGMMKLSPDHPPHIWPAEDTFSK
ncbi:hypothetical protein SLEP1_g12821 [Rubroshorea leprosula]|uniref:Uncharacterized protein n=1 Tax=Rubroshorea leprosula TaxID=152421 RepID=A0AAV5IQ47_9ROSI|nr:hypothetical protein SLEP1_g12821 [Rubroshorea leprosula]